MRAWNGMGPLGLTGMVVGLAYDGTAAVSLLAHRSLGGAIVDHQAIQLILANMAAELYASRAITFEAATLKDRGVPLRLGGLHG